MNHTLTLYTDKVVMRLAALFALIFVSHLEAQASPDCDLSDVGTIEALADVSKALKVEPKLRKEFCEAIESCAIFNDAKNSQEIELKLNEMKQRPVKELCAQATIFFDKKQGAGVGTCGMSDEEQIALRFYIGSGSYCMNRFFRQPNEQLKSIHILNKALNSALDKFPNYEGFVIRGTNLPDQVRKTHTTGNIVTYNSFTSTSAGKAFPDKDVFMFYSFTGKPVMSHGQDTEFEVLFKAPTKFKILETYQDKEINYYVMKEVLPNENKHQTEIQEKQILKQANSQKGKKISDNPDYWKCPSGQKSKVPKKVKQKDIPPFTR